MKLPQSSRVPTHDSDSFQKADTSDRRLRVLVVSPVNAQAMYHGTGLRVHHFVRHLREHHDVSILCTDEFPVPPNIRRSLPGRIRAAFCLELPYVYQTEVHRAIEAQLASGQFDVAILFTPYLLHYVDCSPIPVITDLVDDPILATLRSISGFNVLNLARTMKRVLSLIAYERRLCRLSKINVVVSQKDAHYLSSVIGRERVSVIPNGVDICYFRPQGLPRIEGEIVFSGTMAFSPNVKACKYFAEQIFPRILDSFPKAHWTIAGSSPEPEIRKLAEHPSISVTGSVPDLRPYIDQASVVVSPLITGAGIKNKILEAWAMQKAIVATTRGCAGIDAIDEANILIADDPRTFAEKTVRLLRNPGQATTLGQSGYNTAVTQYSWEDQSRKLEVLMQSAIGTEAP